LESIYLISLKILGWFRSSLKPGSRIERLLIPAERLTKGAVFDCRMCGQCVLHSTGMTCPMTCPKNLRNGPCGGVRPNGHCEVVPEMPCVWVQAWERSRKMPHFGSEILHVLPPLNHDRQGSSAWVNHFSDAGKAGSHWKR
jgi:hypothetical protein